MQFMSQSTGWADNVILAMVPLGIIAAVVGAIRVGGPTWLKALIGRARDSRAIVESELMSSTSHEVCELWNEPSAWDVMLGSCPPRRKHWSTKAGMFAILRFPKPGSKATNTEQSTPAEDLHKLSKRPVAILRNTVSHTPNISLNIRNTSTSREAYIISVFATLLQACLLAYAGLTATYFSHNTQLQETPPAGYAFPCMAAGTLMLVSGMLVCGHVVEGSTSERRFRPVDGKEARVVWLQRSGIVNDQRFESFAIFPTKAQRVITTSQRTQQGRNQNQTSQQASVGINVEVTTVVAVATTMCGFVVQFVGLRGMNWTVSIAQLLAILLMAVLRSLVRRNLAERPNSLPLPPGHELDWLAITLTKSSDAPWLHPDKPPRADRDDWGYRIVPAEQANNTAPGGYTDARHSRAHQAMLIRIQLGVLAGWRGTASAEAVALASAIEIVMGTLRLDHWKSNGMFTWHITSSNSSVHEPVEFCATWRQTTWTTFPQEIEAALSLWLYSVRHREENQEEAGYYSSESWLGGATPSQLQSKRARGKSSLQILGSLDARILQRDLSWWLPDNSLKDIYDISETEANSNVPQRVILEGHRVVGCTRKAIHYPSPNNDVSGYELRQGEISRQSTLAVYSQKDIKKLYACHIFSAFMWALSAAITESPVDTCPFGKADVRAFVVPTEEYEYDTWDRNHKFSNDRLSALIRDIENTGLGSVEDIYFAILPPLSAWNLLPPVHSILKRGLEVGHQLERRGDWKKAGRTYVRILKRTAFFPRNDNTDIASEATALVMEFLRVLTETVELWKDQLLYDDKEVFELIAFREWVRGRLAAHNDEAIFPRLMGLYERQGRVWKCNLVGENTAYPTILPPEFGFHVLHQAACSNKGAEISRLSSQGLDRQDFLGWTAIHYAVAYGSGNAFDILLDLRADANAQDIRQRTPLHYAYRHDDARVVLELLRAGTDINARDTDGMTPLHHAVKHGARKVAAALIEGGADMNLADNGGRTAMAWAVCSGDADLAKDDLWDATNLKRRDNQGRTLLHLAVMSGSGVGKDFGDMFDFLVPAIDKNAKDRRGYTPLHLAAAKGHLSAVQWLLDRGADRHAEENGRYNNMQDPTLDEPRFTPLHLAKLRLRRAREKEGDATDNESD
ncbi:uncharacterized protein B0H64DRAFT_349835, partial [Chaetomium fimeti]